MEVQKFVKNAYEQFNSTELMEVREFGLAWASRNQTDRNQNPYLRSGDGSWDNLPSYSTPICAIFTSSMDEEISCPNWGEDDIRKLTLKTISLAKKMKERGVCTVVILHPNILNKSWHDYSLTTYLLNKHDVEYLDPFAVTSSYWYLENADYLVTWRSTIGVEALISNKIINVISRTMFDELIGGLGEEIYAAQSFDINLSLANSTMANCLIHYLSHYGYKIDFQSNKSKKISEEINIILPNGGIGHSVKNRLRHHVYGMMFYTSSPAQFKSMLQSFRIPFRDNIFSFVLRQYQFNHFAKNGAYRFEYRPSRGIYQ